MAKKTDIKKCRYVHCKHLNKEINILCDEFKTIGKMYYHKDCYQAKIKGEWKDEKTKADLQLIKNLWIEHISDTVVYYQLFQCLNDLISQGIDSDYLVFTIQYCINNKLNLRYPRGFKYFVDNQEIKDAYKKKNQQTILQTNFLVTDTEDDIIPKFSINKKTEGFNSILGGR